MSPFSMPAARIIPLEDELGDVLDKALRCAGLNEEELKRLLDQADGVLAELGVEAPVFVPPFNRFDARHDMRELVRCFECRKRIGGSDLERRCDQTPANRFHRRRHGMQRHHDRWFAIRFGRIAAFARPARQRHAQNCVGHLILFNEFSGEILQFLWYERAFDFQEIRAAQQAFQMSREAERFAPDDAHRFEQPVAIHEPAVVDGDEGLRFGHKMAVEKNEHEDF